MMSGRWRAALPLLRRGVVAVGAAIHVKWFEALDRNEYPQHAFFENPYHLALQELFHIIANDVASHEHASSIEVTLAAQPEYEAQGLGYYAATAALMYPNLFAPSATYTPAKSNPRLQAADIVAYELRKACDNPSVQRWPLRQLRCGSHHFVSKGVGISGVFGVKGSPYQARDYVMKVKREAWPKATAG